MSILVRRSFTAFGGSCAPAYIALAFCYAMCTGAKIVSLPDDWQRGPIPFLVLGAPIRLLYQRDVHVTYHVLLRHKAGRCLFIM